MLSGGGINIRCIEIVEYIQVSWENYGQKTQIIHGRNLDSEQIRRNLEFLLKSQMLEVSRASNFQPL